RRIFGEFLPNPLERGFQRLVEKPAHESQREKGLAAIGFARTELYLGDGLAIEFVHGNRDEAIGLQRSVFQRIGGITRLAGLAVAEGVRVDNKNAAGLEVGE